MAINKRGGNVTPVKAPPTKIAASAVATGVEGEVTNVTVGRSFTIPGEGEYESQKVQIMVSASDYETASALVEEYMTTEFERSSAQFAQFRDASDQMADELGAEDLEGAEEAGEGEGEAEEGEALSAADVRGMTRKDLIALVTDNSLELAAADYSNNKAGTAEFAEAIIEATGLEAEEGGDEAGEEETGEEETGEDALTAADIMAMERSELLTLNKENALGIATKSFPKLKDLQAAIIEAAGLGEEETGEEETGEEPAADDQAGYSRKELEGMTTADLKNIWTGWSIKDKFPVGAGPVVNKRAVNRIMQFQDTGK